MSMTPRNVMLASLGSLLVACSHGQQARPVTQPSPNEVTARDIENQPGESVEKILGNRVAGVRVSRAPDGSIAVQIRGNTSDNNQPLYILDGMPIAPGPGGVLAGISPNDIESIKVLKDAANMAMYGSRGANGIIVIKTKRAQ